MRVSLPLIVSLVTTLESESACKVTPAATIPARAGLCTHLDLPSQEAELWLNQGWEEVAYFFTSPASAGHM